MSLFISELVLRREAKGLVQISQTPVFLQNFHRFSWIDTVFIYCLPWWPFPESFYVFVFFLILFTTFAGHQISRTFRAARHEVDPFAFSYNFCVCVYLTDDKFYKPHAVIYSCLFAQYLPQWFWNIAGQWFSNIFYFGHSFEC